MSRKYFNFLVAPSLWEGQPENTLSVEPLHPFGSEGYTTAKQFSSAMEYPSAKNNLYKTCGFYPNNFPTSKGGRKQSGLQTMWVIKTKQFSGCPRRGGQKTRLYIYIIHI
jgi:hypothetical protein